MVRFHSFCAAGALMLSLASALHIKRQDNSTDSFNLYAYSSNNNGENGNNGNSVIGGVPVFYADGLAWIGTAAPLNATDAANVTFVIDSSTHLKVSSSNSTTNSTSLVGQNLYINPSAGAYDQAGFTSSDNSSATQATTGFSLYGTRVIWAASDGTQQSFFYATPSGTDGLYALRWNSDSVADGVSVPVSLVNAPPG